MRKNASSTTSIIASIGVIGFIASALLAVTLVSDASASSTTPAAKVELFVATSDSQLKGAITITQSQIQISDTPEITSSPIQSGGETNLKGAISANATLEQAEN